jgi:hypothetical protein
VCQPSRTAGVRVTRIPNARLAEEAASARQMAVLDGPEPTTPAADPHTRADWAERRGWDVLPTWSADAVDCFDAILLTEAADRGRPVSGTYAGVPTSGRALTNSPITTREVDTLLSSLRDRVRQQLPERQRRLWQCDQSGRQHVLWKPHLTGNFTVHNIASDHRDMYLPEFAARISEIIEDRIREL